MDFEGSVPYHRMATELFFYPARYRELTGLKVSSAYRERVVAMARFSRLTRARMVRLRCGAMATTPGTAARMPGRQ